MSVPLDFALCSRFVASSRVCVSLYPEPCPVADRARDLAKSPPFSEEGKVGDANGFGVCYLGCLDISVRDPTGGSGVGNKGGWSQSRSRA